GGFAVSGMVKRPRSRTDELDGSKLERPASATRVHRTPMVKLRARRIKRAGEAPRTLPGARKTRVKPNRRHDDSYLGSPTALGTMYWTRTAAIRRVPAREQRRRRSWR